jgi:hypothetical protein
MAIIEECKNEYADYSVKSTSRVMPQGKDGSTPEKKSKTTHPGDGFQLKALQTVKRKSSPNLIKAITKTSQFDEDIESNFDFGSICSPKKKKFKKGLSYKKIDSKFKHKAEKPPLSPIATSNYSKQISDEISLINMNTFNPFAPLTKSGNQDSKELVTFSQFPKTFKNIPFKQNTKR